MKLFRIFTATGVLCLACACTVAPSPTQPTRLATVDALSIEGFDAAFFRAFVQNAYDAPQRLEPIRVLRGPLRLYLQTHDNAGNPVDAATLDSAARTLIDAAPIWSGDTFGVIDVARGTSTREKMAGWITVKWSSDPPAGSCGRSTVGVDGGYIELNVSGACNCGMGTRVFPRLVRHELGHAMGYYHTDHPADVMYGQSITSAECDTQPSERERLHARLAHAGARSQLSAP